MNTKVIQKLIGGVLENRMDDLELMDQSFRVLHGRISIMGDLLDLMVTLLQDRFSGDAEELEAISKMIEREKQLEKEVLQEMNRFQQRRDQVAMRVAAFNAKIAQIPDE